MQNERKDYALERKQAFRQPKLEQKYVFFTIFFILVANFGFCTAALDNAAAKSARIHRTAPVKYPEAKQIPLPNNVEGIKANEIGRFSPQRVRDLNGSVMISQTAHKAQPLFLIQRTETSFDPRVGSFDCQSAVNLNSSMQTNVPHPFSSRGKATHFNMPGGQWECKNKFISEDMQKSHYLNTIKKKKEGIREYCMFASRFEPRVDLLKRFNSTNSGGGRPGEGGLTRGQRLKKAVTEYGSTVIVFHVGISLISLGSCYLLISRYGIGLEA